MRCMYKLIGGGGGLISSLGNYPLLLSKCLTVIKEIGLNNLEGLLAGKNYKIIIGGVKVKGLGYTKQKNYGEK